LFIIDPISLGELRPESFDYPFIPENSSRFGVPSSRRTHEWNPPAKILTPFTDISDRTCEKEVLISLSGSPSCPF
jgi:hypothetical protein